MRRGCVQYRNVRVRGDSHGPVLPRSNCSSHVSADRKLRRADCAIAERVAGLTGVDTRSLTRRLRERGTMKGWLYPATMAAEEAQEGAVGVDMREEVFRAVAPREPIRYARGELSVLLVDVGAKDNI